MASPSVSFRISRNAEDLANTIHALSQRLVTLEQRLAAMELQVARTQEADPEELASLDNVERLLRDCRDLLEVESAIQDGPEEADDGLDGDGPRGFGADPGARDGYPSAA